jgi:hypothetical protein
MAAFWVAVELFRACRKTANKPMVEKSEGRCPVGPGPASPLFRENRAGPMTSRRNPEIIGVILIGLCVLGILAAGVIFLGECGYWLKEGVWPGWTLATEAGGYPRSSGYLGLDKIIRWFFDLRASIAAFLTALTSIVLIGLLASAN